MYNLETEQNNLETEEQTLFIQTKRMGVKNINSPFRSSLQEAQLYLALYFLEAKTQQSVTITHSQKC